MEPVKDRISGSRIAALWDEHRYWTKRMLWEYTATGRRPPERGDVRARSGRKLEQAILEMAAEDMGCEVVPVDQAQYIQHPNIPVGCIADGYVIHPEKGPGLVSAKGVSFQAWSRNWLPMQHGVPRDYELQLQSELLVWQSNPLGFESGPPTWGVVAAMYDLDVHLFERPLEPRALELIAEESREFMDSVIANKPPPLNYTASELPLIDELYPYNGDSYSVLSLEDDDAVETFVENAALLSEANQRKKTAKADIGEAKAHILELSDGHPMVQAMNWQVKVTRINKRASTCKNCGAVTRKASREVRFTAKEL